MPEARFFSIAVHEILDPDSNGEADREVINYGNSIHPLTEVRILGRAMDSSNYKHSEIG